MQQPGICAPMQYRILDKTDVLCNVQHLILLCTLLLKYVTKINLNA